MKSKENFKIKSETILISVGGQLIVESDCDAPSERSIRHVLKEIQYISRGLQVTSLSSDPTRSFPYFLIKQRKLLSVEEKHAKIIVTHFCYCNREFS